MEEEEKDSRVINRVCITQNVALKEGCMDTNKAFWIQGTAHVVNIGFSGTVETGKVGPSEGIEDPGKVILGVVLGEGLVGDVGIFLRKVSCRAIERWRAFKAKLLFAIPEGAARRGATIRAIVRERRSRGTSKSQGREYGRSLPNDSMRTNLGVKRKRRGWSRSSLRVRVAHVEERSGSGDTKVQTTQRCCLSRAQVERLLYVSRSPGMSQIGERCHPEEYSGLNCHNR